jgi:hypothetical protein
MSAVEKILAVAPPDIVEAVRWLVAEGAAVVWEDPPHGMAFAGLEFVLGSVSVRMVCDRGVWMMELRRDGERWLDHDLLRLARQGCDAYPAVTERVGPMPTQIPEGVSWRDELPGLLEWLSATEEAEERCVRLGRSRARQLFPPKRRTRP